MAAAILASSLTYVYSVKTAAKSLLFDAKLRAYGDVVSLYYEIFENLEKILYLQEIDTSNSAHAQIEMWNIVAELHSLGESETLMSIADSAISESEIESKGVTKYVEDLQTKATIICSRNIAECDKKVKRVHARLQLVAPAKPVWDAVDQSRKVIKSGGGVHLKNLAEKHPDVFNGVDFSEVKGANARTIDEWRMEAEDALKSLVRVTRKDLTDTVKMGLFRRILARLVPFKTRP